MSLSTPRNVFGVHSFTAQKRSGDFSFYGMARVIGAVNVELTAEQEQLFGGSQKTPWAVEVKTISTSFTTTFKEYADWLFELFAGATISANTSEASGNVTTLLNKKGTSVADGTTGIASVGAKSGDESDLKFGKLYLIATAADAVQAHFSTNVDFDRGNDESFEDDDLSVGTPVTVPDSGGTVDLTELGLEITGGSGTVAMTTGDSAECYVRPINSKNSVIEIGKATALFPEFTAIMLAAKRGSDELFEIEGHKVQGAGLPINLAEGGWSQADVNMTALYDSALDKTFTVRALTA